MNRLHTALPLFSCMDSTAAKPFYVINDGVMGGVSSSRVYHDDEALVFAGTVSLEHNGGFASCRTPVSIPGNAQSLRVDLRGDGRRYKLVLKLADVNASWQYQAAFQTSAERQTLRFLPQDFAASFRGRRVEAPPLDFARVGSLGVLISDRQAGVFRLKLYGVYAE